MFGGNGVQPPPTVHDNSHTEAHWNLFHGASFTESLILAQDERWRHA
jgi:hypothetical protein